SGSRRRGRRRRPVRVRRGSVAVGSAMSAPRTRLCFGCAAEGPCVEPAMTGAVGQVSEPGLWTLNGCPQVDGAQVVIELSSRRECSLPKTRTSSRSEEHTSELQSRFDLVCRLLLEKK